jgi:hypothetical protein
MSKVLEKEEKKQYIVNLFINNIKNKKINIVSKNKNHDGAEGHWLETQMEIRHNSKNEPDIFGYEMKKDSKRITFGDFSASEYIFSKNKQIIYEFNNWKENIKMSREEFIKYFGNSNKQKHGRYSWSGKCVPIYGKYNKCGQKISIDKHNNICIFYKYYKDTREHKKEYIYLKEGKILIAIWLKSKMEQHINKKFNSNGFFICKKEENIYKKICFGKAFNFSYFIENMKNKNIIFDSGMYCGNLRNYSHFRSSGVNFWNKLIVEEF